MEPSLKPHAVVLAAGASSRMGQPKSLLKTGDRTFVHSLMDDLTHHCDRILVVGGAHIEPLRRVVHPENLVYAPLWRKGMRWSLRTALDVLPPGPVLITHVDRPGICTQTLSTLISALGHLPIIAQYQGRLGHPVLVPGHLRNRLMEQDGLPLNYVFKKTGFRVVETGDPAVIRNINRREDWARLRAS